jgi:hypothetical protein
MPRLSVIAERIVARVRGVMMDPRAELPKAIAEPGDARSVLVPYVVALASVGAIAQFVSRGIIGVWIPPQMLLGVKYGGGFLRMPLPALISSLVSVAIGCGAWWLLAFCIARLAPSFGARSDGDGARKAAAYIATPIWLAGGLALLQSVPYVAIVGVVGHLAALAYAVLVGMQALPLLVGTPEDKAAGHALGSLAIAGAAAVVVTWVALEIVLR